MEPDFNLHVRDRVRSAEQVPLHWRKELVWDALQETQKHTAARSRRPALMVAASLILLMSALTMLYQEPSTPNIHQSLQTTRTYETLETPNVPATIICEPFVASKKEKNIVSKKITKNPVKSNVVANVAKPPSQTPKIDEKSGGIALAGHHETPSESTVTNDQTRKQTIEPIIGYYENDDASIAVLQTKKKMRIHFHKRPEPTQTDEYAQSLIARIK